LSVWSAAEVRPHQVRQDPDKLLERVEVRLTLASFALPHDAGRRLRRAVEAIQGQATRTAADGLPSGSYSSAVWPTVSKASELLPVNAAHTSLRRANGEEGLAAQSRLLAEYMARGTEHQRARRLGLLLNVPLTLEQAAAVLDIRRGNARQISRMPSFKG
jgi:hypothetical protein